MLGRLVKEETGMALGLAIIMVVLIGVMGAGLLVFVRNDLQAVVEVNQGQLALETADAGVKAAKNQLIAVSSPAKYDGGADDSQWSASQGGRDISFDGKPMEITIQYLPPVTDPAVPTKDQAPETIPAGQPELSGGREYFRVISEGQSGGARRKIEAIFNTYALDVPKGYFTPGNITINGSACITDVSLFAQGSVTLNGEGASTCLNNLGVRSHIRGTDRYYDNWQNAINPTPRSTNLAGIGATGTVSPVSKRVAGRDYDSSTFPKFVQAIGPAAVPGSQIRFPFNPDPLQIDLREFERIAREQDQPTPGTTNYFEITSSSESITAWPDNSTKDTVVYYKFTDGTPANNALKWFVSGSCSDNPALAKQGTLVVEGAGFSTQPNKARFRGVVIVREGEYVPGTADDGTSSDSGNTCLEGFVNATGNITISGSVSPFNSADVSDRPGFTGVRQWSWRELYQ